MICRENDGNFLFIVMSRQFSSVSPHTSSTATTIELNWNKIMKILKNEDLVDVRNLRRVRRRFSFAIFLYSIIEKKKSKEGGKRERNQKSGKFISVHIGKVRWVEKANEVGTLSINLHDKRFLRKTILTSPVSRNPE